VSLHTYEFDNLKDMEFFLQGGVSGGKEVVTQNGRIYGLNGSTLIFTLPAGTVQFSDVLEQGLTFQQISQQIAAVLPALATFWRDKYIHILQKALGGGISLSKSGTANPFFGFSSATDAIGTLFNGPSGATPRYIDSSGKARLEGYYVVVEF
jgi:hypothetical protein